MVLFTSLVVFLFVFPINNYIYFYYSFFLSHARYFIQPKSVVRACLDFGFLEEWILFGFKTVFRIKEKHYESDV